MRAVALTDHGNMFGAITLYKAARRRGVQAILGCELDGRRRAAATRPCHLPVARRRRAEGYRNLVWLVSRGHVQPASAARARASRSTIARTRKGLVGMTGCMGGVVAAAHPRGGRGGRRARRSPRCATRFEPGSLYVELQDHGLPEQPVLNGILADARAASSALPLVATNDVHYAERDDAEAHLYLSCIKTGRSLRRGEGAPPRLERDVPEVARRRWRTLFAAHPEARAEHARDRRALPAAQAEARRADAPELPGARGVRHRGLLPPRRARGARRAASSELAAQGKTRRPRGVREAPRDRARRHREDEVRRLLPHRLGLHPLRQGAAASPSARAAARAPARSSPTRCASPTSIPSPTTCSSSASSTPSACQHAGLRHRLLHGPARRGDRLRPAEVRRGQRRPDRHVRTSSRRKSVVKDVARVHGHHRRSRRSKIAEPHPAQDAGRDVHDRRGARDRAEAQGALRRATRRHASCSTRRRSSRG